MMKNIVWTVFASFSFIVALSLSSGIYPIVRFPKEQINIYVHSDHIEVNGYYYYKNPHPIPVSQGFYIPFPVDESHPPPVQISALIVSKEKQQIPIRRIFGKYQFELKFNPKEEKCILIKYYQYAPERNATYLLTTTKPWRQPISFGEYRLFPKQVKITSSNYPVESIQGNFMSFTRKRFMPRQDWSISWETETNEI